MNRKSWLNQIRLLQPNVGPRALRVTKLKTPTSIGSNEWLVRVYLFPETESCMVAVHDQVINKFFQNPRSVPNFMTEGQTYVIPKGNTSNNPTKYSHLQGDNTVTESMP